MWCVGSEGHFARVIILLGCGCDSIVLAPYYFKHFAISVMTRKTVPGVIP